jgi:hypothetical protein
VQMVLNPATVDSSLVRRSARNATEFPISGPLERNLL